LKEKPEDVARPLMTVEEYAGEKPDCGWPVLVEPIYPGK